MSDLINKLHNRARRFRIDAACGADSLWMRALLKGIGVKLGRNCRFWGRMIIHKEVGSTIEFGDDCVFRSDLNSNLVGVNRPCVISTHSAAALIRLGNGCGLSGVSIGIKESLIVGNNVQFGANSYVTDFDWHGMDPRHRDDPRHILSAGITIENDVWIGLNSVILKGVTIGRNTVIGAGSLVTKDIPPDSIAAGNPCRVIRPLKLEDEHSIGGLPAQIVE